VLVAADSYEERNNVGMSYEWSHALGKHDFLMNHDKTKVM